MAIQHVVLFQFPADLSAEDDRTLRARVAGWPVEIGGFHRLRFGSDLTGARTAGYHYLLLTEFDDEGALRRYGAPPCAGRSWTGCMKRARRSSPSTTTSPPAPRSSETDHIRSGALTPSSPRPLASTTRVASHSESRAAVSGVAGSSPIGSTRQAS